jgi:hypothetical protein
MTDRKKAPDDRAPASPAATLKPRPTAAGGLLSRLLNRSQAFRRYWLIAYWAFIFFLTHWPNVDDFPGARWLPVDSDLVVHFSMYAGWAAAWWWLLAGRGVQLPGRVVSRLLAGAAAYGIFDELTQALVGRDPELGDLLMDMAGVVTALLLLSWLAPCKPRARR